MTKLTFSGKISTLRLSENSWSYGRNAGLHFWFSKITKNPGIKKGLTFNVNPGGLTGITVEHLIPLLTFFDSLK